MSSVANATIISPGEAKSNAIVAYTLIGIGLFTAIPIFIGAIWAMIKRSSAMGTIYHSHYTNAIRTFWWGLFWWIFLGQKRRLLGDIGMTVGVNRNARFPASRAFLALCACLTDAFPLRLMTRASHRRWSRRPSAGCLSSETSSGKVRVTNDTH